MTFLYANLICMGVPLFYLFGTMFAHSEGRSKIDNPSAIAWIVGSIFAIGTAVGFFAPREVRPTDTNWSPIILFAGAVLGVVVFGFMSYRALRSSRPGSTANLWQGAWILSTCASAYIGYTAVDHFFFWKDKDRVGIATSTIFANTDVKCGSDVILLKRDGNAFIYRCPHNIALGNVFLEPFVPWPSYDEGRSELLLAEYEQVMHDAKRTEQSTDAPPN